MTRLRWPLLVGFVAGIALANCGKPPVDPKTLNGTALFVTCTYKSSFNIRQFLFTGEISGGNDAFPSGYRPDPPSTVDFSGPQTARILLNDALAGQDVALTVYALDVNGEIVEAGYATTKIVKGIENDVQVDLTPFVVAAPDGGTDAGLADAGVDAGTLDAGKRDDGGTSCDCATGCCILGANPDGGSCAPSTSTTSQMFNPPLVLTSQFCGRTGQACVALDFCDPLRANTCAGAKCACGNSGGPCPEGTRCAPTGSNGTVFSCICDKLSNCDGCCVNQASACLKATAVSCGAAGQQCVNCGSSGMSLTKCEGTPLWGQGACATFTDCATCKGAKECCSGNSCNNFGGFPTCRAVAAGLPSVCESCDIIRSNGCHPVTGQCACGDGGSCGANHFCKDGQCRSLF